MEFSGMGRGVGTKKDSTVTMGVPAFFRWLTRKYPSVIVDAVEEKPRDLNGVRIPVNTIDPNPNFQEFDNLYLDMNGIIHPCTHPEDRPSPKTEEEMFVLIFEYIDRLFAIVRPRKLLYMAIDGVAPRAKMNQQRSRRFRASKEAVEKVEQIAEIRSRLENEGYPLPPEKEKEHFDSNCITPGTPFMARLAVALRYYIHQRLNSDPGWEKIAVILSDANVPGEGEHKIMDFIRRQRASPSHDPNTVHCLCGADADLIMLGLATHEPNFNIIREEFVPNQQRPCDLCGQYGHELNDCKGLARDDNSECQSSPLQKETNFIFVRLPVLREYLERELYIPNSSIPFDLERAIDDWVFMCFFVGNDFLPHLPSLEIRENAIDRLVKLYKDMVCEMKGYLTDSGIVNIQRAQIILSKLGEVEDEIFKSRQEREQQFKRKNKERKWRERAFMAASFIPSRDSLLAPQTNGPMYFSGSSTRAMARTARLEALDFSDTMHTQTVNNVALHIPATNLSESTDRKHKLNNDSSSEDEISDEVRLWENGWKDRYYKSKFQVDGKDIVFRRKVALAYIEGLCWVLHYYYQGCASWDWYYPFHYAPFASDFDAVSEFKPDFSAYTEPFKPLQQLMGVFPAASRMHLPEAWQDLMISSTSPIIDFYPDKFVVDLNGKKYAWQGIALLPFVDEKRLLEVLKPMEDKLDAFEKERNSRGSDRLFVGSSHPFYKFAEQLYEDDKEGSIALPIDTSLTFGMAGTVGVDAKAIMKGKNYKSPFLVDEFADIAENKAIMMIYEDPQFEKGYVFAAKRLSGAIDVPRTLKDINLDRREPYRPQIGFSREIPRHGLSDAGRRMLGHSIGQGPRPPFDAYQIDSHNRPHQSSSWIPAGSYADDRMPNYSPIGNQFRERRQMGGEWYGNSRRYRNFNEYERISQLPIPLRHPFRYEPYPGLISSRARSRGRDRPLQHSVYRW